LGNIPRKSQKTNIDNSKIPVLKRSLTIDLKVQNNSTNNSKEVLREIGSLNNIIAESEESSNMIVNSKGIKIAMMNTELDAEMDKYDLENMHNPQVVSTVAKDIFVYLKTNETEYLPKSDYMSKQNDINEKMRAILIDWLVDVNVKFKLVPEALYMTVNLIDRY